MDIKTIIVLLLGAVLLAVGVMFLAPTSQNQSTATRSPSTSESTSSSIETTSISSDLSLEEFQDAWFLEHVEQSPEWVSQLRMFGEMPDPTGDQFNDASIAGFEAGLEFVREGLSQLRTYDLSAQSFEGQTASNILEWYMDNQVRSEEFMLHPYVVFPGFGVQNAQVGFMTDTHEVHSRQDAENYISRLGLFMEKFHQVHLVMIEQERRGIVLPKTLIPNVITGMEQFIAGPASESPLYTSFVRKLEEFDGLSQSEIDDYSERARNEITDTVYPAYQMLIDYMRSVEPNAPGDDEVGVWRLPNGAEYYEWLVRNHTTTDMTPEEIHQLGNREVARIHELMIDLLREEGFEGETFNEIYLAYSNFARPNPDYNFPATPEGEAAALAEYHRYIDDVKIKMADAFNVLPQAPVDVRPVPDYAAATSPGAYYQTPSFDGSRPGVFYINFGNGLPFKPGMQTLTYHEAIPGHHFQLALQQESENLPDFQKILIFTSHAEGWALYTEKLAREYGMFEEPFNLVQNMWSELFRAARLVVDTGIHYKRWSLQEAADYYTETLGFPIWGEIYRYVVIPGQALAYKTGELKIIELRERARDALGTRFDIKDFHDVVLMNGGMPLSILEEVVDHYIETTLASN